ncbi:hypothetical protein ACTJK9_23125 [Pseudomonas sp. 22082]|uniref:hypothetical protein n=1 Tax=Pseudomonas TaxID=286 RepID=UPI003F8336A1
MPDNNFNVKISDSNSDEQYVQVPIKKKDFGDFITNLLGQPEKITGTKSGTFEASHEWLIHLHHLLDQRIKQQASCALVDFSATLRYDTGPERKITTINGFLNFNEATIVLTKSIELTWTYLVNFPNKPAPEKQEISLQLITDNAVVLTTGTSVITRTATDSTGIARFTVAHTERTWGDDIASLLTREIDTIFEEGNWLSKAIGYSVIFFALGMLAAGIFTPDYVEQLIREKETAQIFLSIVPENSSIEALSIDQKLNLTIKLLDPNNQLHAVKAWYRAISFLTGIGLAALTLFIFMKETPSFILITKRDKDKKAECEKTKKSSTIKNIASYALAIAAGVFGNYVYYYLNL